MARNKQLLVLTVLVLLTSAFVACAGSTPSPPAQTYAPRANIQVSRDRYPGHAEPFLAVNPYNSRNLLGAAWFYLSATSRLTNIGTFASFDGGTTWQDNGLLPLPPGFTTTAAEAVVFNAQGMGFVVAVVRQTYADDAVARVVVWRTDDGGRSFAQAVTVAQGSSYDQAWAAVDATTGPGAGSLYVAWQDHCTIVLSRSADAVRSFTTPHIISSSADRCSTFPIIALGPTGILQVVYAVGPTPVSIEVVTSSDKGRSFESPQVVPAGAEGTATVGGPLELISSLAAATDPRDGTLYGERQGLAVGPTSIYPCWNDARTGQLQIFLATVQVQ
jgi:hypothetical protein